MFILTYRLPCLVSLVSLAIECQQPKRASLRPAYMSRTHEPQQWHASIQECILNSSCAVHLQLGRPFAAAFTRWTTSLTSLRRIPFCNQIVFASFSRQFSTTLHSTIFACLGGDNVITSSINHQKRLRFSKDFTSWIRHASSISYLLLLANIGHKAAGCPWRGCVASSGTEEEPVV